MWSLRLRPCRRRLFRSDFVDSLCLSALFFSLLFVVGACVQMSTSGGMWSRDRPLDVERLMKVPGFRETWHREYHEGRTILPLDIWCCEVYLAHSLDFPVSSQTVEFPTVEQNQVQLIDRGDNRGSQMETQHDSALTVADDILPIEEYAQADAGQVLRRTRRRISRVKCPFCG